jgi:hypothetical protein
MFYSWPVPVNLAWAAEQADPSPAWYHPFIEVKRPGEVPEPHQVREHDRLRKAGFVVLIIDSTAEVDRLFPAPPWGNKQPELEL